MSTTRPLDGDARADAADHALGVESSQPGQNEWARQKIAMHRHLLQSNAEYQRAWLEKQNLPPDLVHPAFRTPGLSLDTSLPIPTMRIPEEMREEQRRRRERRESTGNTTPPSTNVNQHFSPDVNLGTTPDQTPQPTQRAWLEERTEQLNHNASGSTHERVPVFYPTPNPADENVAHASSTNTKQKQAVKFVDTGVSTPSTKKKTSFFDRFRFGGKRSDVATTLTTPATEHGERFPPKAEAVLGTKSFTKSLSRPGSKRGFFSRRPSMLASKEHRSPRSPVNEPTRPSTSMGFERKSSLASQRATSQAGSEAGRPTGDKNTPNLGRSKSLKYVDSSVPPTPPSKDTPPDVKTVRDVDQHRAPIVHFANRTPTQTTGFVSTTGEVSPTKNGSYAFRKGARLATAPSMHSMHASVDVNRLTEDDAERVKGMSGLGLAGLDMPSETPCPSATSYSPSIYSPDNFRKSMGTFPPIPETVPEGDEEDEIMPAMKQRGSFRTEDTTMTSGTIPFVFPELSTDPDLQRLIQFDPSSIFSQSNTEVAETKTPAEAKDVFTSTPGTDGIRTSSMKGKQAVRNGDEQIDATSEPASPPMPIMSPMSRHPSAQVLPLQPMSTNTMTLSPDVYTPKSKSVRRRAMDHNDADKLLADRGDSPTLKGAASSTFANAPKMTPVGIEPPQTKPPSIELPRLPEPLEQNAVNSPANKSTNFSRHISRPSNTTTHTIKSIKSPANPLSEMSTPSARRTKSTQMGSIEDSGAEVKGEKNAHHQRRVSTAYAEDFYLGSPRTRSTTMPKTPTSRPASDSIQRTPNLPTGRPFAHHTHGGHVASSRHSVSSVSAGPDGAAGGPANLEERLMRVIENQQVLLEQMADSMRTIAMTASGGKTLSELEEEKKKEQKED